MDLLYPNAKDLIQSWRIYIRAPSLSLVYFRHLATLVRSWLISHINIYHLFAGCKYIISLSLQFANVLEFRLWRWNMIDLETEMKELARSTQQYSQHKIVDPYISSMSRILLQSEEATMVKQYKHIHTHTHTHNKHTHTSAVNIIWSTYCHLLIFFWKFLHNPSFFHLSKFWMFLLKTQ